MKTVIKTLLLLTSIIILGSCSQKKIVSLELKNKQLEQRIDTLKMSFDFLFRIVARLDRNSPDYKHWVDSLAKAKEAKKAVNLETLKSLEQTKDKK